MDYWRGSLSDRLFVNHPRADAPERISLHGSLPPQRAWSSSAAAAWPVQSLDPTVVGCRIGEIYLDPQSDVQWREPWNSAGATVLFGEGAATANRRFVAAKTTARLKRS